MIKALFLFTFITSPLFAVQAEILTLEADYSIPTLLDNELLINTFKLQNYQIETFANGAAIMSFEMPTTMVGHEKQNFELELVGKTTASSKILSGPAAKAVCVGAWVNMECSITFTKLTIDQKSLKAELFANYSEAEALARYNLLLKFKTDPIGTVKVQQAP